MALNYSHLQEGRQRPPHQWYARNRYLQDGRCVPIPSNSLVYTPGSLCHSPVFYPGRAPPLRCRFAYRPRRGSLSVISLHRPLMLRYTFFFCSPSPVLPVAVVEPPPYPYPPFVCSVSTSKALPSTPHICESSTTAPLAPMHIGGVGSVLPVPLSCFCPFRLTLPRHVVLPRPYFFSFVYSHRFGRISVDIAPPFSMTLHFWSSLPACNSCSLGRTHGAFPFPVHLASWFLSSFPPVPSMTSTVQYRYRRYLCFAVGAPRGRRAQLSDVRGARRGYARVRGA